MTKPEPLTKEKIKSLPIYRGTGKDYGHIHVIKEEDVKSAVDWLLKEIEKREKIVDGSSYLELQFCKDLIKKAFEGVIKGETHD